MGEPATQIQKPEQEPAPSVAIATTTPRATIQRAVIEADAEQRALLKEYIERNMIDGSDYGVIPGTAKPTLLKPGAEKLVDLFRAEPHYEISHRVEDWDRPLFHYEFRCVLKDRTSGIVYAEGFGSCNSMEGRYRWRNGDRVCPECGQPATIIKGKEEYGGGWLCWERKGGCGAKFQVGDKSVEGQTPGKIANDDVYTLVNTVLKMAKKRALVDASIALARCSDIFTQDVEDLGGTDDAPRGRSQARPQQQSRGSRRSEPPSRNDSAPASRTGATSNLKMPYGGSKGKSISDPSVPDKDLEWMAKRMADAVQDPSKDRYRDSNQRLLEALQKELIARQGKAGAVADAEIDSMGENDAWGMRAESDDDGDQEHAV